MALPPDFASVLDKFERSGILKEPPEEIESRLALTVQSVALKTGQRGVQDLGIGDWTLGTIKKLKASLHSELCDAEKRTLKEDYKILLNKGLTPEGITAVATVVAAVISAVNPAFAVSNIIIFLAIWMLKRGLGRWCSLPV